MELAVEIFEYVFDLTSRSLDILIKLAPSLDGCDSAVG
jgi:hypothetical protein